jgi:hypothetical protein
MHLSTRVLGKHIADQIASKAAAPLLTIGRDNFYRRDLAGVACFNFTAASNLSKHIATLQPRDTKDVFETVPPVALVIPRLGSVSLAVLGAAFEAKGIGGEAPLEAWFSKHLPKDATRDFVTFSSMKHSELLREAGEKKARKQRRERTASRRDRAQRIRGERYITRRERTVSNGS